MSDQPESMGIDEAVDALMEKHKTPDSNTATGDDVEDEELESSDTDDELDDEDESEEEDLDPEEEEESDPEEEESEEGVVFKVTDEEGNEVGVNAEEARLGYLRQRDYTKKTQEVASEKREVQTLKDELTEAKGQIAEVLSQLTMAADKELAEFAGIDWTKLEKEDPYEYEEKSRRFDAIKRQRDQASEQEKLLKQDHQRELQERVQAVREEEMAALLSKAPEFDPEKGGAEVVKALQATARDLYGYTDAEIGQIMDHRAYLLMRDAQRYHELKAKLDKGKSKVKDAPKHVKPGAKTDQRKVRSVKQKDSLRAKLKETGSIEDALEMLMASSGVK